MTTKNLMMDDIKVIFKKMLQENEASIFQRKPPNVSQAGTIYSGNNSLTNQRLNSLNKDINDLNESMEFFQSAYNDKLKNLGGKVQKPEEEINLIQLFPMHLFSTS